MSIMSEFESRKLVAVCTISDVKDAVPTAEALLKGGISAIELTLRTPAGLDCIKAIRKALPEIAVAFGADMIGTQGMKRDLMREIVFSDPRAKEKLESILHPMIKREMFEQLKGIKAPYVILSVPLLLESGRWADAVKRVLVIDVSEDEQINRLVYDRHLGEEQARAIIETQISRDKRVAAADDLIDNSGTLEDLEEKVKGLHQFYLKMAEGEPTA